jgi:hypothetical protein
MAKGEDALLPMPPVYVILQSFLKQELQSLKVSDEGNSVALHRDEIGRIKPIPSAGYVSMRGRRSQILLPELYLIHDRHPPICYQNLDSPLLLDHLQALISRLDLVFIALNRSDEQTARCR